MNRVEWIRQQAFGRILDVGCNDGVIFNDTPHAPNCHGLDLDTWKPRYGLGFTQGDASALPFQDKEFDCVVLGEILEHVPDPVKVLKEARRVARGSVFISVPNEHNWSEKFQPMMPLADKIKSENSTVEKLAAKSTTDLAHCGGAVDEKTNPHLWHIRYYTLDMLCEHLDKAGLRYKIELLQYEGWSFFMGMVK